ncbi:MAG TPA: TonB-dependent receptor, partial [Bryobacteraceae bacterium]|nr:TonB-dependent receptor [Bryobacteraceae bacterium]
QNWAAGWTHIFGPTMVNQVHGGWHKFSESEVFGTTNDASFDVVGKMNLPLVSRRPDEYGPPTINVSGPEGGFDMYNLQRQIGPRIRSNGIIPITDVLSIQKGHHFLKIGAEWDRRLVTFGQARAPRGSFTFDGTYTGSALADFMLGYLKSASVNPAHTSTDLHNIWQGYFVNDDWKVTPRLTLTLGMRYDYYQKYKQSDDKFANILQNGFLVGDVVTPANSPYGRGLIAPDYNNWGPRFGFAYRPGFGGESVIRGGYGIYYTPEISNAIFAMAEGAQATAGASVTGNLTGKPNIFFNDPFSSAVTTGALNFAVSNDQNMRDSYIQQWNLNIQHKMPLGIVLDTGYVGSKGTRLYTTYADMNRPIAVVDPTTPGLASLNARRPNQQFLRAVQADKSNGNSIYHSLQVKAEKRASHGVTFLSAYTWAKSISGPNDIGGQVGGGFYIGAPQDIYNARADRNTSGFDLRQRYVQTILYDVPFFNSTTGLKKKVLDGWQASVIMTYQGGFPAQIDYGVDTTGTGTGSRPDVVAGQAGNLDASQRTWLKWFNTAAFAQTPNGRFGTAPRTDAIRLPGTENIDFSATKRVLLQERRSFEFRAEMFNLLNHFNPDPQTLDRNIRSKTFGTVGGGVQGITTRVIQVGAKLNF